LVRLSIGSKTILSVLFLSEGRSGVLKALCPTPYCETWERRTWRKPSVTTWKRFYLRSQSKRCRHVYTVFVFCSGHWVEKM